MILNTCGRSSGSRASSNSARSATMGRLRGIIYKIVDNTIDRLVNSGFVAHHDSRAARYQTSAQPPEAANAVVGGGRARNDPRGDRAAAPRGRPAGAAA